MLVLISFPYYQSWILFHFEFLMFSQICRYQAKIISIWQIEIEKCYMGCFLVCLCLAYNLSKDDIMLNSAVNARQKGLLYFLVNIIIRS